MLVLSRKPGEAIHVGDDVRIYVVRITPHTVRIGIEAPQGTVILREELVEREHEEGHHDGSPTGGV